VDGDNGVAGGSENAGRCELTLRRAGDGGRGGSRDDGLRAGNQEAGAALAGTGRDRDEGETAQPRPMWDAKARRDGARALASVAVRAPAWCIGAGSPEGVPAPMRVAFPSLGGRPMCGRERKGVSKMTTALRFCVIGVASVFLLVGEACFACATWMAERCCGEAGARPAGGRAGKKGVKQ